MKSMWKGKNKKGFTLVELSLSIAFISILSITVALIINDAISTYRRGLTLNQVNTVGMDLVDDIRAVVQNSPSKAVVGECLDYYSGSGNSNAKSNCEGDGAQKFVMFSHEADLGDMQNVPMYGAFCTGAYSYIWNSGYFDSGEYNMSGVNRATLKYKNKDGNDVSIADFRLLKVKDQQRAVCKVAIGTDYEQVDINANGGVIDISSYGNVGEDPEVILVNDSANPLALYDLEVAAPAANSLGNSLFYPISFILGTVQGGINIMSNGNFCKTPTDYDSNFDYCAINKFNFAAQATGG